MNKIGVMAQCNKQNRLEIIPILSEFIALIFITAKLLKQIYLQKFGLCFYLSNGIKKIFDPINIIFDFQYNLFLKCR